MSDTGKNQEVRNKIRFYPLDSVTHAVESNNDGTFLGKLFYSLSRWVFWTPSRSNGFFIEESELREILEKLSSLNQETKGSTNE